MSNPRPVLIVMTTNTKVFYDDAELSDAVTGVGWFQVLQDVNYNTRIYYRYTLFENNRIKFGI